ncbi:hypothetical protein [Lacisediminihabitans sp.]|uniref:hypothetical protein n=1 Tax=Lacisediminihabitans sp. TaxID=2787631 RepID=UPI00374D2E04
MRAPGPLSEIHAILGDTPSSAQLSGVLAKNAWISERERREEKRREEKRREEKRRGETGWLGDERCNA